MGNGTRIVSGRSPPPKGGDERSAAKRSSSQTPLSEHQAARRMSGFGWSSTPGVAVTFRPQSVRSCVRLP
jgi:hypothetical protein